MAPPAATHRAPDWLGSRLKRRRVLRRAADRRLAATVTERRRPKRMAASRRLAPRPVVAAAAAAPVAAAGLSEFASRWMFGDGVAEGVPFAGGAAAEYGRPSFLEDSGDAAPAALPPSPARPGTPMRSSVEEVGPRFRLSRTPPPVPVPGPEVTAPAPPQQAEPQPAPAEEHHEPATERPVVRVVHEQREPERQPILVRHIHEATQEADRGSRRGSALGAARVAVDAARVAQRYEEVKEVESLGHRIADAARSEWSKLRKDASEWSDKARHEFDHLKHEGEELRGRVVGEAHHLEREGRGLRRRAFGEAHHLEREGRALPGRLEHGLESAERSGLRSAARFIRRQPLVRAATGLVRTASHDLSKVGTFEQRALRAEHRLEGALRDPEKELGQLGRRLEKQVLDRPIVRRAETALTGAERSAASRAKAAALAAAAEVPLAVSKAGRAVVQFESAAGQAAHRLEAGARQAVAAADGHRPAQLPHEPHLGSAASTVAGRAAAAAAHAQAPLHELHDAATDRMYDTVVDRLRRDLLAERERMGNLLGEWP